jgi:NOL1/NOP2/fmu family ribosome biogenesis protein
VSESSPLDHVIKLTSQCPSSSTLDVELSGRQSADGFDRQIFVANAGTTGDLLVRWQESLIGGARRIARRLRPKNNFARRFS